MNYALRPILGALMLAICVGAAAAKNKLTFAYVTDPSHEIYFHAIRQGIVKSDRIDLQLVTTSIPALGQAMLGKQYDIIETSSIIVPAAVAQGLNIQILSSVIGRQTPGPTASIWVSKDSPVTSVDQLKGRKVATYGLGSTAMVIVRVGLNKKHGFNVALRGGDIQFVEMPTAAIPAAIKAGSVDAGMLLYAQVDQAQRSGEFRPVFLGGETLYELAGARMVLPVVVGFPERIAAAPDDYREFLRMMVESLTYAHKNPDLISKIATEHRMPDSGPFLKEMIDAINRFNAPVEEVDLKAINYFWNAAKGIGLLQTVAQVPDVRTLVWPESLKPLK